MKYIITLLSLFFFSVVEAAPAPFSLEIGKATLKDVQARYKVFNRMTSEAGLGFQYDIDLSSARIEGLQSAKVMFDEKQILVALEVKLDKDRFEGMFNLMSGKYRLHGKEIPFVGDKSATFSQGDTIILLSAPHMSFSMSIVYIQQAYMNKITDAHEKAKRQQQNNEASNL